MAGYFMYIKCLTQMCIGNKESTRSEHSAIVPLSLLIKKKITKQQRLKATTM
jgi:hypothetical protein